jgi:hypothetical protein
MRPSSRGNQPAATREAQVNVATCHQPEQRDTAEHHIQILCSPTEEIAEINA